MRPKIDILSGNHQCENCNSKFAAVYAIDNGIMQEALCYYCLERYLNDNF